jgi:membrane fusion protein, macrolide-specific efflux system
MKSWKWMLGGVLLIFGVGITGLLARRHMSAQLSLSEPLQAGKVISSVYGIGTVMAHSTFTLKPGITTTLSKLYVAEGETVKRGARLADLENAASFVAPFDGFITHVAYKTGEAVFSGSEILSMVDLKRRYIKVSLEQQAILQVQKGQRARLSFDSYRETQLEGEVVSVYSSAEQFLVRIEPNMLPARILPGMTADVAIEVAQKDKALLVPVSAVHQQKVTRVLENGKGQEEISIQKGLFDRAFVEVLDPTPLKPGDRLLLPKATK